MRHCCGCGCNALPLDEHLTGRDDPAIRYVEQPRGVQHNAVWHWSWRFLSQSRE
jgi:hypothetical protein